jgi:hypothetical protein
MSMARHHWLRELVAAAAAGIVLLATTAPAQGQQRHRPFGDIRVFATFGYPGTPGGVAVDGKTAYVDTSAANFDRPFDGNDKIYAFDVDTARPVRDPMVVQRQYPVAPMGLPQPRRQRHAASAPVVPVRPRLQRPRVAARVQRR